MFYCEFSNFKVVDDGVAKTRGGGNFIITCVGINGIDDSNHTF